jgi:hypothetical protein
MRHRHRHITHHHRDITRISTHHHHPRHTSTGRTRQAMRQRRECTQGKASRANGRAERQLRDTAMFRHLLREKTALWFHLRHHLLPRVRAPALGRGSSWHRGSSWRRCDRAKNGQSGSETHE